MKNYLLVCCCWLACAHACLAQSPLGVPALDQFLVAASTRSVKPLEPYLSPETQVDALPAALTPQILAQLLPALESVTAPRLVRQEAEGANRRYVCALTYKGKEKEFNFLLSSAGKFLEMNFGMVKTKQIETRINPRNIPDLVSPDTLDVPMKQVAGLLLVEAEADGRRGSFLLDTGAPGLILDQRQFGPPAGQTTAGGSGMRDVNGDMSRVGYHVLESFNWAGLRFGKTNVLTQDLTSLGRSLGAKPLLGIIGYGLLQQYELTLDYRAGRVRLHKPGGAKPTGMAGPLPLLSIPFQLSGHLPVIEVNIDGQPYRLALDCGAQQNLLDKQYETALLPLLRKRHSAQLEGGEKNNRRKVVSAQLRELTVADRLVFRKQKVVFADITHLGKSVKPTEAPPQGLLGYPFLSQYRTAIDYVNKQVHFYPW